MLDLEHELKSLKLYGMATAYAEVAHQGGASPDLDAVLPGG